MNKKIKKRFVIGMLIFLFVQLFFLFEYCYNVPVEHFKETDTYKTDNYIDDYSWGTLSLQDKEFSVIEQFIYFGLTFIGLCPVVDYVFYKGEKK